MDEQTLAGLMAALAATPQNAPLLAVVLEALAARGEADRAAALLEAHREAWPTEPGARARAAALALDAERADLALGLAEGEEPRLLFQRARALLALDRLEEGRTAYERAVAASPALEDADLRQRLNARVVTLKPQPGGGKQPDRRLRVIANDDTDQTEITRLLNPAEEKVTFADVGGLTELKEQIRRRIITPFKKPGLFERFRRKAGGGILMYGPPGVGKTLLARATAGECSAEFYNVAIADILDMYIGESERKLHAIFEKARQSAPAVLFFDEVEALGGRRQHTREATSSKLVSQFLSEMDGFAKGNSGVLILAATNVPWAIDPAFRRPGRFDRVLFVPPPDEEARRDILRLHLAERPVADDIDIARLARLTSGHTGADLANLIETAADEAIAFSIDEGREVPISMAMLTGALKEVRSTAVEWLTTARNYARYANEAGQYDEVLAFLDRTQKR